MIITFSLKLRRSDSYFPEVTQQVEAQLNSKLRWLILIVLFLGHFGRRIKKDQSSINFSSSQGIRKRITLLTRHDLPWRKRSEWWTIALGFTLEVRSHALSIYFHTFWRCRVWQDIPVLFCQVLLWVHSETLWILDWPCW